MSSHIMATSMVGLNDRDSIDPDNIAYAPPNPDASTPDRDGASTTHLAYHTNPDPERNPSLPPAVALSQDQTVPRPHNAQERAINNLLAHLVGNNGGQQPEANSVRELTTSRDNDIHHDITDPITLPTSSLSRPSSGTNPSAAGANGLYPGHDDSDTIMTESLQERVVEQTDAPEIAASAFSEIIMLDSIQSNPSDPSAGPPIPDMVPPFDSSFSSGKLRNYSLPWNGPTIETTGRVHEELPENIQKSAERGQIEAFAKLEFADGNYYITTHSCELGRDVRAYQAAMNRAKESNIYQSQNGESSSGNVSRLSSKAKKEGGSQVKGSVVSDRGGICGVDDAAAEEEEQRQREAAQRSSNSSIVKPEDLDKFPPLPPFDYHSLAREASDVDNEVAAPVTNEHLPPPNRNPLIPIHATADTEISEIERHRAISRRHVRIAWDFEKACFKLHVLGLNGAFLNGKFMFRGHVAPLRDGARIQISGIEITFKLPHAGAEDSTAGSGEEEEGEEDNSPNMKKHSTTPTSDEEEVDASEQRTVKIKTVKKPTPPGVGVPNPTDAQTGPVKKRGPGRPPKDGISSNREKREQAKAAKLAAAREANGGVTPPLTGRGKVGRPLARDVEVVPELKPEKRKYTKRKRAGSEANGELIPSIEGGEGDAEAGSDEEGRTTKKARASRSLSPDYPPKSRWTDEQLQKPQDNYARMIYDILMDIYPKELGLRQIYRHLKMRHPYFVHTVTTDGWQSSVRHNLNQEHEKLFHKGQKDGKGWAWRAIPGGLPPKDEVEKIRKQPPPVDPKTKTNAMPRYPSTGPPRPGQFPPGHPQGPPFPYQMPPGGPPPHFYPHPSNGSVIPPGTPPNQMNPYVNGPPPGQGQMQPPPPRGAAGSPPVPYKHPGPPPFQGGPPPFAAGQYSNGPPPVGYHQQQPLQQPPPNSHSPHPLPPQQSTDPTMPCTPAGAAQIRAFEDAMLEDTPSHAEKLRMQLVFNSVRARALHGAKESAVPGGETGEERVLLGHVMKMVDMNRNEAFIGWGKISDGGGEEDGKTKNSTAAPAAAAATPPARIQPPVSESPKMEMEMEMKMAGSSNREGLAGIIDQKEDVGESEDGGEYVT